MTNQIARNLQALRRRAHLSQEALAERVGVARQTVAKWESGESAPDLAACEKLSGVFGVTLDALVHYNEAENGFPIPPKGKHLFGLTVLGERGQIVIPKEAREVFDLHPGDKLLVLGDEGQGLALVKSDSLLDFIRKARELEAQS